MAEIVLLSLLAIIGYKLKDGQAKDGQAKDGQAKLLSQLSQQEYKKKYDITDVYDIEKNLAKKNYIKSQFPEKTGVIPNFYNQLDVQHSDDIELDPNDIHNNDIFINYGPSNFKEVTVPVNSSLSQLIETNTETVVPTKKNSNPNFIKISESLTSANEKFTNLQGPEKSFLEQFQEPSFNHSGTSSAQNADLVERADMSRSIALDGGFSHIGKDMTYNVISDTQFTHNNMVPYYSGKNGYGLNRDADYDKQHKLEMFSGTDSNYQRKQESTAFFQPVPQINMTSQVTASGDQLVERYMSSVSQERRNELLQDPERITPGVNLNADEKLQIGYHSTHRVLGPTVDQMRVATKPKISYEARINDGIRYYEGPLQAEVMKKRPQTFKETMDEDYLPTKNEITAPKVTDNYYMKETAKENTLFSRSGGLYGQDNQAGKAPENYRNTNKQNLEYQFNNRKQAIGQQKIIIPAVMQGLTDNNVESWSFHNQQRETTGPLKNITGVANVVQGNYSNLQDIAKPTVKENTNLDQTKYPVIGPNVYQGTTQLTDNMRTTTKETTLSQQLGTNISSMQSNGKSFNPSDLLRNTIKETTLSQQLGANISSMQSNGKSFDPSDLLRTTIKEGTIDNKDVISQFRTNVQQVQAFNPFDLAKPTIKETTIDTHEIGSLYYGATNTHATGYQSTGVQVKNTNRETTTLKNLIGTAYGDVKKDRSYDDAYNAETNTTKEIIAQGREPTPVSYFVTPKIDNNGVRLNDPVLYQRENYANNNMATSWDQVINSNNTRVGQQVSTQNTYVQSDVRLDPELLKALNGNVYTFLYNYK